MIIVILGFVLIIIGTIMIYKLTSGNNRALLALIIIVFGIGCIMHSIMKDITEELKLSKEQQNIEITCKDSINVDSIIIYKLKRL